MLVKSKRLAPVVMVFLMVSVLIGCSLYDEKKVEDARQLYKTGHYEQALSILSEVIESDPKKSIKQRCWFIQGKIYLGLEEFDLAFETFSRAKSLNATNYHGEKAFYKMAKAQYFQRNYAQAEKKFKKIAQSDSIMRGEAQAMLFMLK